MVTLLANIHFWSFREDVIVKDADVGAFRYQDKVSVSKERVYYEDKRSYVEARGGVVMPKNSRPGRLRDSLKEFEDILWKELVVWEGWRSPTVFQVITNSGLITSFVVDPLNGDIVQISFDKFLVGRLLSEHVADGIVTSNHIIFSYNESRLTMVHLSKLPLEGHPPPLRLASWDTKVSTCQVDGPPGRRFERKLSVNVAENLLAVWWHTSDDEIYPWSPVSKDRNRANILVYSLSNGTLDLLCYCRTEMSSLSVTFSKIRSNLLLTVEQGFAKKGSVSVHSCSYEVDKGVLERTAIATIPLEAPLTAHAHHPSEDRLLLACNNGILALHSDVRGMTHITKASLIPSNISWMSSGTLVIVSNDRGQIQCFDSALSLVRMQILMEDLNPQRMLDLSEYFCHQQSLEWLSWAPINTIMNSYCQSPHLLMLHFAHGPLACLTFDVGTNNKGLTIEALASQYIKHHQIDEAINLLVSLNWNKEGELALQCLTTICNYLLKLILIPQRETQMEASLGTFHVPVSPITNFIEDKFGPAVRAITRRFFFKVLRSGRVEKAYRLALDLKDHDCFLAVHHVALCHGDSQLASAASASARELESDSSMSGHSSGSCSSVMYGRESGDSSCSSDCSDSCSSCYSGSDSESHLDEPEQRGQLPVVIEEESPVIPSSRSPSTTQPFDPISHIITTPKVLKVGVASPSHQSPPPTTATAITSEDGTITINIRTPDPMSSSDLPLPIPPPPMALKHPLTRSVTTPSYDDPRHAPLSRAGTVTNKSHGRSFREEASHYDISRSNSVPPQPGRTVRDLYYSNDHNEQLIDGEHPSMYAKLDLQSQYERTVYQEVSTEEEDGGTVKVVHFGVV